MNRATRSNGSRATRAHNEAAVFRAPSTSVQRASDEPLALDPKAFGLAFFFGGTAENERRGCATIVTIEGPLEQRASWWDGYDAILARFDDALADADTSCVVLRIDSPGGECAGLFELVRTMRAHAAASSKRVVAYVDEAAYSAAYALASVASEVYLPPSGGVGSIGVIAELVDQVAFNQKIGINVAVVTAGARKADGHPDIPISESALEACAARVAGLAELFFASVAESRPLSVEEIAGLEAACFYGEEAVAAGLADGVCGFADVLAMLADDAPSKGADAPKKGQNAMNPKTRRPLAAAPSEPVDILARPLVGASPADVINAAAAAPSKTETTETVETEEAVDEENGTKTTTTTTTTTESETMPCEESAAEEDDEGEDDEEDDGEDAEGGTSAIAPATAPARASTTRDVLALVRTLTGEASPGAQMGALSALADRASKAIALEKRLAKATATERRAKIDRVVDKAIRAGKLTPSQRAWATETGLKDPKILDGYLNASTPVVAPTLREPSPRVTPKGAAPAGAASPATALTPEEIAVAKEMHIDPAKLAAFKASGGNPTITH